MNQFMEMQRLPLRLMPQDEICIEVGNAAGVHVLEVGELTQPDAGQRRHRALVHEHNLCPRQQIVAVVARQSGKSERSYGLRLRSVGCQRLGNPISDDRECFLEIFWCHRGLRFLRALVAKMGQSFGEAALAGQPQTSAEYSAVSPSRHLKRSLGSGNWCRPTAASDSARASGRKICQTGEV